MLGGYPSACFLIGQVVPHNDSVEPFRLGGKHRNNQLTVGIRTALKEGRGVEHHQRDALLGQLFHPAVDFRPDMGEDQLI